MNSRERTLISVLILTTSVGALISSVGAPLIPAVSLELHVSYSAAQWTLTVSLLVACVAAPIFGRLGDGPWRKQTLIYALVAVTLGGVIAALAESLPLLLLGRALQGVGFGLAPLTMSAARDHLSTVRAQSTIAILSVCIAAGVGIGYPLSGFIAQNLGLAGAYWFSALISAMTLIAVIAVVPASTIRTSTRLDLVGALLLGAGLVSLLLAIAEGNSWGWRSLAILGLIGTAGVLLVSWVFQQLRAKAPLVELRLLRLPAVLTANTSTLIQATALYLYISAVAAYVQAPDGTGLGASVTVAGLCLLPLSLTSVAVSRLLPSLTARFGARSILPVGSLVVSAAGAFLAVAHRSLWQAFVMMALLGVGVGMTSGAIPGIIVRAVPPSETGSALGFSMVVRFVGFSAGSALAGLVLAAHTPPGSTFPTTSAYVVILWVGAVVGLAAAIIAWALPGSHPERRSGEDGFLVENSELGPTGLIALPEDSQ